MKDEILDSFLHRNFKTAAALAKDSDILEVIPAAGFPPYKVMCRLAVDHLARNFRSGMVEISRAPIEIGLYFGPDYLKFVHPLETVTMLSPTVYHPNVLVPYLCTGDILPGMELTELLWHSWEILTYQNMQLDEKRALNPEACRFIREHPDMLSRLEIKPLRRRKLNVTAAVRDCPQNV